MVFNLWTAGVVRFPYSATPNTEALRGNLGVQSLFWHILHTKSRHLRGLSVRWIFPCNSRNLHRPIVGPVAIGSRVVGKIVRSLTRCFRQG